MSQKGHIEPIVGMLRLGGDYSQDFYFSALLRYVSPTRCEVVGVAKRLDDLPSASRMAKIVSEIREVLIENGLETAFYQRKREDGSTKIVEFFKDRDRTSRRIIVKNLPAE